MGVVKSVEKKKSVTDQFYTFLNDSRSSRTDHIICDPEYVVRGFLPFHSSTTGNLVRTRIFFPFFLFSPLLILKTVQPFVQSFSY